MCINDEAILLKEDTLNMCINYQAILLQKTLFKGQQDSCLNDQAKLLQKTLFQGWAGQLSKRPS